MSREAWRWAKFLVEELIQVGVSSRCMYMVQIWLLRQMLEVVHAFWCGWPSPAHVSQELVIEPGSFVYDRDAALCR